MIFRTWTYLLAISCGANVAVGNSWCILSGLQDRVRPKQDFSCSAEDEYSATEQQHIRQNNRTKQNVRQLHTILQFCRIILKDSMKSKHYYNA